MIVFQRSFAIACVVLCGQMAWGQDSDPSSQQGNTGDVHLKPGQRNAPEHARASEPRAADVQVEKAPAGPSAAVAPSPKPKEAERPVGFYARRAFGYSSLGFWGGATVGVGIFMAGYLAAFTGNYALQNSGFILGGLVTSAAIGYGASWGLLDAGIRTPFLGFATARTILSGIAVACLVGMFYSDNEVAGIAGAVIGGSAFIWGAAETFYAPRKVRRVIADRKKERAKKPRSVSFLLVPTVSPRSGGLTARFSF